MADKLSNGLPARVILETTIVQEGEVFKHSFDEMGRIVQMNDNYYLRYTESKDNDKEEEVATLIKIEENGVVSVTRHEEETTKLTFNDQEPTFTNYTTPAGILQMLVETERLSISYTDQPFAGEVEVDYVIKWQGNPLGTYQMRLRFTT
jgi:uncharacterized beta-barrel protein YwiB (DUF1934 family)